MKLTPKLLKERDQSVRWYITTNARCLEDNLDKPVRLFFGVRLAGVLLTLLESKATGPKSFADIIDACDETYRNHSEDYNETAILGRSWDDLQARDDVRIRSLLVRYGLD